MGVMVPILGQKPVFWHRQSKFCPKHCVMVWNQWTVFGKHAQICAWKSPFDCNAGRSEASL